MNQPHLPTPTARPLDFSIPSALVPPGALETAVSEMEQRAALLREHVNVGNIDPTPSGKRVSNFSKAQALQDLHVLGEAITMMQRMQLRLSLQIQALPDDEARPPVIPVTAPAPVAAAPSAAPQNLVTDFGFKNDASHPRVVVAPEAMAQRTGLAFQPPNSPTEAAAPAPRPTLTTQVADLLGSQPQPTADQVQRAAQLDREKSEALRRNFQGSGSLFARFLSPDVIVNGKGALKPGRSGLKLFDDDVLNMTPDHLLTWPAGFYRNRSSGQMQFLIHSPSAVVIVDGLPNDSAEVVVHIRRGASANDTQGWVKLNINQLSLSHLMQLTSLMETTLSRIPTPTAAEMMQ